MPTLLSTLALLGAGLLTAAGSLRAAEPPAYDPTSVYEKRTVQGWTVYVNPRVREHPEECRKALERMDGDLAQIVRLLPAEPVKRLREVPIWVEWQAKPEGAAEFHPSRDWLREHGYNPEKAQAVEINNVAHYLEWTRTAQPMMLLHELAHAYEFRVLADGPVAPEVRAAYQAAREGGAYESVPYVLGGKRKAYALADAHEYFAELTEAYFGRNDFFPFTAAELKQHDPRGYALVERAWGPR